MIANAFQKSGGPITAAYDAVREYRAQSTASNPIKRGDPEATGLVMLKLVDMDEPPLRLFLGKGSLEMIRKEYAQRLAEWEKWNDLSEEAHGEF